jgi:hypothetical protein
MHVQEKGTFFMGDGPSILQKAEFEKKCQLSVFS